MSLTLLKPLETARRCAIGRSTLFALVKEGSFPQPVRVTRRNVGFIEAEVSDWLEARAAERGNTE